MQDVETQKLAELLAILQENKRESNDSAFLRSSLENINARLDRIESGINLQTPKSDIRPLESSHPSRKRFEIPEGVSNENGDGETEKICPYEPTGKPCDHCSMCSSLGF